MNHELSGSAGVPVADAGDAGEGATAAARTILLVRAAGNRVAIPAREIREVVPGGTVVRVPESPGPVGGLMAVRGEMVTVVDLALALGWRSGAAPAGPGAVAVLREGTTRSAVAGAPSTGTGRSSELLGLRVDVVEDLAEYEGAPAPPAVPFDGPAFRGVLAPGPGGPPAGLLDAGRLVAALEEVVAAAATGETKTGGDG